MGLFYPREGVVCGGSVLTTFVLRMRTSNCCFTPSDQHSDTAVAFLTRKSHERYTHTHSNSEIAKKPYQQKSPKRELLLYYHSRDFARSPFQRLCPGIKASIDWQIRSPPSGFFIFRYGPSRPDSVIKRRYQYFPVSRETWSVRSARLMDDCGNIGGLVPPACVPVSRPPTELLHCDHRAETLLVLGGNSDLSGGWTAAETSGTSSITQWRWAFRQTRTLTDELNAAMYVMISSAVRLSIGRVSYLIYVSMRHYVLTTSGDIIVCFHTAVCLSC